MLEKDPEFWLEIVRAAKESNWLIIKEIHLAADADHDLMYLVSSSVKKGHYETSGLKRMAYYSIGGKRKSGTLGKYSSTYETLKSKDLRIHSLYVGNSRYQPVSVVLYDKEEEQVGRKSSSCDFETRIE